MSVEEVCRKYSTDIVQVGCSQIIGDLFEINIFFLFGVLHFWNLSFYSAHINKHNRKKYASKIYSMTVKMSVSYIGREWFCHS